MSKQITITPNDFSTGTRIGGGGGALSLNTSGDSTGSRDIAIPFSINTGSTGSADGTFFVDSGTTVDSSVLEIETFDFGSGGGDSGILHQFTANAQTETRAVQIDMDNGGEFAEIDAGPTSLTYNGGFSDPASDATKTNSRTYAPFYTTGSVSLSKTLGDAVHLLNSVTLDMSDTENADVTVSITDETGTTQTFQTSGTKSLSLQPSQSVTVDVSFSSTGQDTASFRGLTLDTAPAVQVYQNGNWAYEPITILASNGSEIDVQDVSVYQNGAF